MAWMARNKFVPGILLLFLGATLCPRPVIGQIASRRMGDLTQDMAVTVFDLIRLQQHLDGSQPLSAQLQLLADLNQDGLVSAADLTSMEDLILEARPSTELPPPSILQTSPVSGEAELRAACKAC